MFQQLSAVVGHGNRRIILAPRHCGSLRFSFSAYCIPDDVISHMADTKGVPMGYTVVNQVLNRNAGELVYAAEGYLSFCYDGIWEQIDAEKTG